MKLGAVLLVAPAALAMAIAALATTHGIGVTYDATIYLDAARHLAAGDGFVATSACTGTAAAVTHFPPLYPAVLSLFIRAGLAPTEAARLLQVLLFGANVTLVAAVVLRQTKSPGTAAAGALLAATALPLLEVHTAAWSEPLFLFLALLSLTAIAESLERPRAAAIVLGAVAAGLAALTRYVGGALLVAIVLGHLLSGRERLGRRFLLAAVTGALAAALPIAWAVWNLLHAGHATDRVLDLRLPDLAYARAVAVVLGSWILPGAERLPQLAAWLGLVAFVGVGVAVLVARLGGRSRVLGLHRLFIAVYLVLFFVSIAAFDHGSPVDARNLAPIFVSSLIIVTVGAAPWRGRLRLAAAALVAVAYAGSAAVAVRYLHENGRGYLGPAWQYPRLFAELPEEVPIYSNFPDAVTFLTGRRACGLPVPTGAPRAAVVYFEEPRRFTPNLAGSVADPGPGLDAVAAWARAHGLTATDRERNAVLFR